METSESNSRWTAKKNNPSKLVHRSGRKIMTYMFIVSACGSIGSKRMADGKLQLLSYLPFGLAVTFFFVPFFGLLLVLLAVSSFLRRYQSGAFKQKRTCFVVFVPKQEINQTLYVQRSIFVFHFRIFVLSPSVARNRPVLLIYQASVCVILQKLPPFLCCSLIISPYEMNPCVRVPVPVLGALLLSQWKREMRTPLTIHFSRCFRS